MPTLHSNNPVPSNGSVATVIRGRKSISMTLSGVGAVRAVVQIMAHEDGAAPGPIGNQIVVSGTTTVTATQTFNADAGKVYLQLIDITPNCKFSATLTDLGPIQDTNPGSPSAPFATFAALQAALPAGPSAGVGGTAWYLDAASPIGRYKAMWEGEAWGYGYLPNLSTAPGSPSNPFASVGSLPAPTSIGIGTYYCLDLGGVNMMEMQNFGGVWKPKRNGAPIFSEVDLMLVNAPGNVNLVTEALFTLPADFIKDSDQYRIAYTYYADSANASPAQCGIQIGGTVILSTLPVSAGTNLWVDADIIRKTTKIRRTRFTYASGPSSGLGELSLDLSVSNVVSAVVTPGNGADKIQLTKLSIHRI